MPTRTGAETQFLKRLATYSSVPDPETLERIVYCIGVMKGYEGPYVFEDWSVYRTYKDACNTEGRWEVYSLRLKEYMEVDWDNTGPCGVLLVRPDPALCGALEKIRVERVFWELNRAEVGD